MTAVKRTRFGVIGDPIAHSRSPRMHAAAFAALGLPARLRAVRASARGPRPASSQLVRDGSLDGVNVTIPLQAPHPRATSTQLDSSAAVVGAANTLVRGRDGHVVAYNTDVPALADELRRLAPA